MRAYLNVASHHRIKDYVDESSKLAPVPVLFASAWLLSDKFVGLHKNKGKANEKIS